jgi:hypothetical protein
VITFIDDGVLEHLPLTELFESSCSIHLSHHCSDLSFNELSSLPLGLFRNLTMLNTLWLTANRLTFLHADIFTDLTSLITLSGNNLFIFLTLAGI